MKYTVLFLLLACVLAAQAVLVESTGARIAIGYGALSAFGLAAAYGVLGPRVFGKRNGTLPPWSYAVFGAFLAVNHLLFHAVRWFGREEAHHEIVPGLHLGRRLTAAEAKRGPSFAAVLDLTSEFGEPAPLRSVDAYRCIPLLDATPPTVGQIHEGVALIADHVEKGPVYVHCAMGHGRSATFVVAYLVKHHEKSLDTAAAHCRAVRPGVKLHDGQRRAVQDYMQSVPASES